MYSKIPPQSEWYDPINGLTVVSMFDGISCGLVALIRAGFKIARYVAFEIDANAIAVSQWNFDIIEHRGTVEGVDFTEFAGFDLLIGGSPCQGFSFAGKQLNFDDPRSALFFDFVRAKNEINPQYFLLENVRMKKEFIFIISEQVGADPILINSALVSGQNRERYYWTNIKDVALPEDREIYLSDIVLTEGKVVGAAMRGRYVSNGKSKQFIELRKDQKSNALTTSCKNALCVEVGKAIGINGHDILKRIYSTTGKSPTLTAASGGNQEPKIAINAIEWRKLTPLEYERLQTLPDHYTDAVSQTHRRRQCGNGWTVDVIAHIFNFMHDDIL